MNNYFINYDPLLDVCQLISEADFPKVLPDVPAKMANLTQYGMLDVIYVNDTGLADGIITLLALLKLWQDDPESPPKGIINTENKGWLVPVRRIEIG